MTTRITERLCKWMLQKSLLLHNPRFKQVRYLSPFSLRVRSHFSPPDPCANPSSSAHQLNNTHKELSWINFSGIANLVLSRCSHLLEKQKGKNCCAKASSSSSSLKHLLFDITCVIPDVVRKFRRASRLEPEDILEIVLGFDLQCRKFKFEAGKVESLWGIFKWAYVQGKGFRHLPQSCQVMASMLIKVEMFREVELLLSEMGSQEIFVDYYEVLCDLMKGYAGAGELDKAVSLYEQMRGQRLVPQVACYRAVIDILVSRKKIRLAFQVCLDMVDGGFILTDSEKATLDNLIRFLCVEGKIQDARNLVRETIALGYKPSNLVLDEITSGYCEKMDFDDLLGFFAEFKHSPGVLVGNKIMHSLCSNFGVDRANLFLQELEHLGFSPDEITFGILVGWSCCKGNLKNALYFISEMFSRGLKPDVRSYNAITSGVFNLGMWKYAQEILNEMVERGIEPNISTFKILLAGYCRARQFDKVQSIVENMLSRGFIQLSPSADYLSGAFMLLGFDASAIRVKRDNVMGFHKTEFFDNLGNGLYLDTDLDMYDKRVNQVLEDSLVPDFNSLIMEECGQGNLKAALKLVNEMVHWGQELLLSVFSELVKLHCSVRSIKRISSLMESMPKMINHVDQETSNTLVQAYCKKGLTHKGKMLLDRIHERKLAVRNDTYTALIIGFCKRGTLKDLHSCWDLAGRHQWLPNLEDCKALIRSLCKQEMLKEVMELLERMLIMHPNQRRDICDIFLEELCTLGFTSISLIFLDEIVERGFMPDGAIYSFLVRGFCKERKFTLALSIFDSMQANFLSPSKDVSVLLIPLLCKVNRFGEAIALNEVTSNEQPSSSLLFPTDLMKGFYEAGRFREVVALFKDMLSKELLADAEACNVLVRGYCQVKNLSIVKELLAHMIRKNSSLSVTSYRSLVRFLCMESRIPLLLNLKDFMLGQHRSFDIVKCNILIFYLFLSGNQMLVTTVINELQKKGLEAEEVTYNFLVYGYSKCKDIHSAVSNLYTMIYKNLKPSNRSLRRVISYLCDTGHLGKALEISREMASRGWFHCSVIQNSIVEGLLSHGRASDAEKFLDRMVEKNLVPENIDYNNLIKKLCLHGRLNKAVDLANVMLQKKRVPDSTSYDSIICGLCKYGKLEQAMNFINEMLDMDLKPSMSTWARIIDKFCHHGRTGEAAGMLKLMVEMGELPTKDMYTDVVNGFFREKHPKKASDILQMMQRQGYEPDFETHWSLVKNLSSSDDSDKGNKARGFLSRLLSRSGFP